MMNRLTRLRKPKNAHLAKAQFDAYQDGALTEAGEAAYRQHLDACPDCREWTNTHKTIAQQLRNESLPPAFLSPAAAARIQASISSRMRRALIMNNMKAFVAATAVVAVLALIVGFFALQTTDGKLSAVEPEELFAAVEAADVAEVERLLEAGADPNAKDSSGNALLPQAVQRRDPAVVQALVEAGADIEGEFTAKPDRSIPLQMSGLLWTAFAGDLEMAEFLIDHGANVNRGNGFTGVTPLHAAAYNNQADIIELLLENGADPNKKSTFITTNGTPLYVAIAGGSVEGIEALLKGGAEVNLMTSSDQTPLMFAQDTGCKQAPNNTVCEAMTRLLLEHGADPNIQDGGGDTALHVAARMNRKITIPLLVEYGASLDLQNNAGRTAVDVAIAPSTAELLQELADEETTSMYGPTPCDEVDGTCLFLHFDGEACTYVGPSGVGAEPVTFIYHNESLSSSLGGLAVITGDQTLDDYIEWHGEEPNTGGFGPMWTEMVYRGNTLAGETHTWEGQLDEGIHLLFCVRIVPGAVWYGGGFTVEY